MLMIQPAPKRITGHGEKILTALQQHGASNWVTRSQVAALIGKKRLTAYDMAMLELLADRGLIESRQREGGSREGYVWEYRAK